MAVDPKDIELAVEVLKSMMQAEPIQPQITEAEVQEGSQRIRIERPPLNVKLIRHELEE